MGKAKTIEKESPVFPAQRLGMKRRTEYKSIKKSLFYGGNVSVSVKGFSLVGWFCSART